MDTQTYTDFDRAVEENFRRNFMANILDIGIFMFALNVVSQTTIMPLLVSHLTSSPVAIGLIPAIANFGYLLPQLLMANYTEGLRRKKGFVLLTGVFERLPFALIGIAVWYLAGPTPTLALVAILALRAISALSGGIGTPAWYDLIAKVIPVDRRGLYSGVGNSLGALLGIGGAALAGAILNRWPYPQNFAIAFLVAFVIMDVSWLCFLLNREPDSPTVKHRLGLLTYLRQLPAVIAGNANYRRYLISRAIVIIGGMAAGFYMVYGAERFAMAESEAGLMTALLVGSQAVANLLWGSIGDRLGHKLVLIGEAVCGALAAASAYLATSPAWLWLTFILMGIGVAAGSVSGLNIILEFCAAEDRPTYIGLTSSVLAPMATLAPIAGGWLAAWAGYRTLFLAACLAAALGGALMALWVQEPRAVGVGDNAAA